MLMILSKDCRLRECKTATAKLQGSSGHLDWIRSVDHAGEFGLGRFGQGSSGRVKGAFVRSIRSREIISFRFLIRLDHISGRPTQGLMTPRES